MEEQVLKAAKEIVVKFIETGRTSPTGFAETFKTVYGAILETVSKGQTDPPQPPPESGGKKS
jgi:hypothetical protein